MGELLDYLQKSDTETKPKEGETLSSDLDRAINTIESTEARELLQAKARVMKAEYDARERDFRHGGVTVESNTEKKVEDAAAVAAEAAGAGVTPEDATNLATDKTRVVVIKPETPAAGPGQEEKGGWEVLNGKPIRDPEGDYTFSQALKVAQLEIPRTPTNDNRKTLAEELTEAKQKLEALGIYVGAPPPPPAGAGAPGTTKSLKEEVTEAMALLQSLGLKVKTNEQAPLKEQVAEAKALLESLGLGVGVPGESLESIREKHHHQERMEEIKADGEYKQGMVDAVSDITERVGMGAGRELRAGLSGGQKSGPGTLETLICEKCKTTIYITPETGTRVECPNPRCREVYTREKITPGETEAPGTQE